eukprot:825580-Ditylum_brightwellii.AAC.1
MEIFLTYWRYDNHSTLEKNVDKVRKVMNKEDRNYYLIPFPCWMPRFIPHIHVTPQGLIIKPEKNDRLVFDGSIKLKWDSKPVNSMTHVRFEPEVTFGQALPKHLVRIWNLRISYPDDDILLWGDDAISAFRQCKLHPDISKLFSFIIDNISPANWDPIRRAREAIAKCLFTDESLIEKHKDYTNAVQFGPLPTEDTVFAQAVADSQNKGAIDSNGNPVPTAHN